MLSISGVVSLIVSLELVGQGWDARGLTRRRNRQRLCDSLELFSRDKGWVSKVSRIEKSLALQVANNIFSTEAVPHSCDLLDLQGLAQVSNDLLDDRIHSIWQMSLEPAGKIHILVVEVFNGHCITVQQVRDDSEESTRGEVVSDQLDVLVDAEDVAKDDDRVFGRVIGGARKVGINCWYWLSLSWDHGVGE